MIDPNASSVGQPRRYVSLAPSKNSVRLWMLSANRSQNPLNSVTWLLNLGSSRDGSRTFFSTSAVFIFWKPAASTFPASIRIRARTTRLILFLENADSTVDLLSDDVLSFDSTSVTIHRAQLIQLFGEELHSSLKRDPLPRKRGRFRFRHCLDYYHNLSVESQSLRI
ncbi:hypothetical protein T03_14968 [Trichinella britovi]|uniref:Uncharacterized protein n=1 Tax=Trichinella britovi TaxID=45882 RepID=A0A0V1CT74_TRIBR|nr:hypothetical protein T03_14968 [Trichinella britovi]